MSDPILVELREARHRRGVSLQRLAEQIGRRTYSAIWQWESGTHDPGLRNLREWAGALGYDLALIKREADDA